MNFIKNVINVWNAETRKFIVDDGVLVFFLVVPFLYPLLYMYLYSREVVREVPAVVVDDSHSALSREFIRNVDASPDIQIIDHCSDIEAAKLQIKNHNAYGVIWIPADFNKDIAEGRQTQVSIYADMSGLLYYKSLLSACTEVSLDMNKEIKAVRLSGLSDREKEVAVQPIEYDYVPMFNSQNGFSTFLLPAVLMLLLQQTLVLGITMMAGTERERRRRKNLRLTEEYGSPIDVLTGKGLAYFIFYCLISFYVLCIVPKLFGFNQLWNFFDLAMFVIPFLLASVFFAISLSTFVNDRESCFLLFVFISVPLLFISGISWPACSIPTFWKFVSYIFPSTFGINGFVRMTNSGALLPDVKTEYIALWVQTGVYFMTALLLYIKLYRSESTPETEEEIAVDLDVEKE
ncbi:MAG: ABC transporter permease [Salinivirgaceae bacterium]|nr:ABC transporter permease [Salinivirgaceae bacterium]